MEGSRIVLCSWWILTGEMQAAWLGSQQRRDVGNHQTHRTGGIETWGNGSTERAWKYIGANHCDFRFDGVSFVLSTKGPRKKTRRASRMSSQTVPPLSSA